VSSKKLKVEFLDAEGNRYTILFEGRVSRDKILALCDLVELLGGMKDGASEWQAPSVGYTKFDKLCLFLKKRFPFAWFSSRDVQKLYEQEFHEPLNLSTVSTYLARMTERGLLIKKGASNNRRYKMIVAPFQNKPDLVKDNK